MHRRAVWRCGLTPRFVVVRLPERWLPAPSRTAYLAPVAKPRSQSNESHNQKPGNKANPNPEDYTHRQADVRQDRVVRVVVSVADYSTDYRTDKSDAENREASQTAGASAGWLRRGA